MRKSTSPSPYGQKKKGFFIQHQPDVSPLNFPLAETDGIQVQPGPAIKDECWSRIGFLGIGLRRTLSKIKDEIDDDGSGPAFTFTIVGLMDLFDDGGGRVMMRKGREGEDSFSLIA